MNLLINVYVFISILFFLTYSNTKSQNGYVDNKQLFFIIISFFVLLLFHCAVDINSVADLNSYENDYHWASFLPFSEFNSVFRTKEYVYNYFNKFVSFISYDFRFFLMVYNIILFTIYYYTFKRYSVNPAFSIICFVLVIYFQSIFVLRQHLAVAILLLSFPFIIKRQLVQYLLICLLAFFTHFSSIAWLPVYFIYNLERKSLFFISIAAFVVFLLLIGSYLGDVFILIGADYSNYLDADTSISLTIKLIYIFYLMIYVFTLKQHIFKQGINRLTTILLFMCTLGFIFAPPVALVDRMLTYYNISLIFAIPIVWSYLPSFMMRIAFAIAFMVLQGYISTQPLSADYYSNYKVIQLNVLYYLLMMIATCLVYIIYRKQIKSI